jgi:hypothetical protein
MVGMFERIVDEPISIPFSGPGAGVAPLTWGQTAMLMDMRETGWTHNISGGHPLPTQTTAGDVVEQMADLIRRYPALRMRLGTDDEGNPCQVVDESGEMTLNVMTVPSDATLAEAIKFADEMWLKWLLTHYDLASDWCMRTGLVRHKDLTLARLMAFHHLVVDGTAAALLLADLGVGGLAGSYKYNPETIDILELARREQTPALRKVSDRAMRYWESHIRDIPSFTFGEPRYEGRQGHRYWHGRFGSPAAYLAVLSIAERTRADTGRVLLAIIAIAVARATGVNPLTAKLILSNRFRPGLADAIAPLSQNTVITMDTANLTVDEAVARSRRVFTAAGMHSYYDPNQLQRLIDQLDDERGYPARVSLRINDRRIMTRRATEEAVRTAHPTREQIEDKRAETFLSWDGPLDILPEQGFITIEDYPDTVYLQVIFDLAVLTESQVEALLRGVEEIAIEAAFDATVPTRVSTS